MCQEKGPDDGCAEGAREQAWSGDARFERVERFILDIEPKDGMGSELSLLLLLLPRTLLSDLGLLVEYAALLNAHRWSRPTRRYISAALAAGQRG